MIGFIRTFHITIITFIITVIINVIILIILISLDSWHITVEYNTILNTKMWSDAYSQKGTHISRTQWKD